MLNPADSDFVAHLAARLPEGCLRPVAEDYLREPRGRYHGLAGAVAAPRATEELAQVVRLCAEARVGIVPRSGGTGLVGGQVMTEGPAPLLISLERMTRIRACYPEENVLIAEAGCILQDVHSAAEAVDRLYPLSLGSQGSCRIGGNLATNAGGVNVLRYGNARELCLG
ncbi:FAD-binding oxidoreductase, partial [Thioclava sp. BHET1]